MDGGVAGVTFGVGSEVLSVAGVETTVDLDDVSCSACSVAAWCCSAGKDTA